MLNHVRVLVFMAGNGLRLASHSYLWADGPDFSGVLGTGIMTGIARNPLMYILVYYMHIRNIQQYRAFC